jgi:hypothetical protein
MTRPQPSRSNVKEPAARRGVPGGGGGRAERVPMKILRVTGDEAAEEGARGSSE